jgi:hypothetical protein
VMGFRIEELFLPQLVTSDPAKPAAPAAAPIFISSLREILLGIFNC